LLLSVTTTASTQWVTTQLTSNNQKEIGAKIPDRFILTMGTFSKVEQSQSKSTSTNSPITVNLEISKAPRLNETAIIKLLIHSAVNADNTEGAIELPDAAIKIEGDIYWKGNLAQGVNVELVSKIKFVKEGNWEIKGYAKHEINKENYWGDVDYIYLNVTEASGSFGYKTN
jgi:hypothetical protein